MPNIFPLSLGVDAGGHHHADIHDATTLSDLLSQRVQPYVGIGTAAQGPAQKVLHHLVQVPADARHLALGDAIAAQGFDQIVHPPGGHPFHIGLLDDRQQREVSGGVLADAKHGVDHGAGGIVHRQQQGEFGASVLQPGVMAAVQLQQHPRLGHPLAAKTVLRRAPTPRTADAGLGENAAHRGPAQVDALALPEQHGEVGVVGALVAVGGQFHHGCSLGGRDSVVGTAATVTVGQCGGAILAISRQQPAGMA